ncbi:DUF427 domain-containing protein [Amnibacterium endophyticum]|uniref:DUF427 domain-containing protein n=1 Tax=Amnibacterium endophyticum TaxID=2109337 RepID=A0ABW4LIQ7_9MICO
MALGVGTGPLSPDCDGAVLPARPDAFLQPYPRRVRAIVGDRTVLDTEGAVMLHAAGRMPQLWFPAGDVSADLLPEGATARPGADDPADAIGDRVSIRFSAADRWLVEDEPVYAHFKDPYHRVDVLTASRSVVVRVGGEVVAESLRPKLLFETGLPVRYYVPWADTAIGAFERSGTVSECPYKGDGQHWHVTAGGQRVEDAAWSLPRPLPEGFPALEHVAFYAEKVELEVDGRRVTA